MAKKNLRINVPKSPNDLVELTGKIVVKHQQDGAASPLNGMKEKDKADFLAKAAAAKDKHDEAKKLRKQSEKATEDRDNVLGAPSEALTPGTVRFYVTAVRDLLVGVNKGNEHALGDWGFTVDTSPRPAKAKPPVKL